MILLVEGNLLFNLFDLIGQVPEDSRFHVRTPLVVPAVAQNLQRVQLGGSVPNDLLFLNYVMRSTDFHLTNKPALCRCDIA